MTLSVVILGEKSFQFLQELLMTDLKYNSKNKYEFDDIVYYSVICESPYHYLYNQYLQKADIIIIPKNEKSYLYGPMIEQYAKKESEIIQEKTEITEIREFLAKKNISTQNQSICCC